MPACIAVTKERFAAETRTAVTADNVRKLIGLGYAVPVEAGAGLAALISAADHIAAGATVAPDANATLAGAAVLFKVRPRAQEEIAALKTGAVVVALLDPYCNRSVMCADTKKMVEGVIKGL